MNTSSKILMGITFLLQDPSNPDTHPGTWGMRHLFLLLLPYLLNQEARPYSIWKTLLQGVWSCFALPRYLSVCWPLYRALYPPVRSGWVWRWNCLSVPAPPFGIYWHTLFACVFVLFFRRIVFSCDSESPPSLKCVLMTIALWKESNCKPFSSLCPSSIQHLPAPPRCHAGAEAVSSFSFDVAQVG